MKITKHAKTRSKERNGWNNKATERMIPKILEQGIKHECTKGNLNKWVSTLYRNHKRKGTDIRLYGDKAYIFVKETLITVIQIPADLANNMNKYIRQD